MYYKDLEEFVEMLYPYFKKKMLSDNSFKNFVKRKNATVTSTRATDTSNIGSFVSVVLPYDTKSFQVKNETGVNLDKGNLVCIEYCIDLKNAIAVYKVN